MQTAILVVTYAHDKPWLNYCIRSINKFASGFSNVTILVPQDEVGHFSDINSANVQVYDRVKDKAKWHLDHQRMKCRADTICPDADFILHTDSDCIFTEPITPEEYFVNGKPVLLVDAFQRIGPSNWKTTTDAALGIDSKWETMRRHPAVHYHDVYPQFREAVAIYNKKTFDDYVLSCKPDFPWGFSEFNAIGNFIMERPQWKERYHIVDLAHEPPPKSKLTQFWSHWGINGTISDQGPNFGKRPRDIMEAILA